MKKPMYRLCCLSLLMSSLVGAAFAAQPKPTPDYAQMAKQSADVGATYLTAYFQKDWATLDKLLAENATFADPTATRLFGAAGKTGKAVIMQAFRENYAPISFDFQQERSWGAIDHVVFTGQLSWTYQLQKGQLVVEKMPMMVVLQIVDGQVVSHLDYADYRPYFAAEAAHRRTEKPAGE
ncbi:MAG: nuclear transport factor 2 family protein [Rheinheimera sp.]|nr:nuclear transport factor 2 family protein [Rheinheimera sp.]